MNEENSASMLKQFILDFAEKIPVTWDHYTNAGTHYYIYGWIERTDGKRDFVLLEMEQDSEALRAGK